MARVGVVSRNTFRSSSLGWEAAGPGMKVRANPRVTTSSRMEKYWKQVAEPQDQGE